MGRPRIKKKKKTGHLSGEERWIRLSKDDAMELLDLAKNQSAVAAVRHLQAMRPDLGPTDVQEVAMRCSDPQHYGGVRTGSDPVSGDYAELLICGQTK